MKPVCVPPIGQCSVCGMEIRYGESYVIDKDRQCRHYDCMRTALENFTVIGRGFSVTFGSDGRVSVYVESKESDERAADTIGPAEMRRLGLWLVKKAAEQ